MASKPEHIMRQSPRRNDRGRMSPAGDSEEDDRPRSRSPRIKTYQYESNTPPRRRPPPPSQAIKRVKMFRAQDFSAFIILAQRLEKIGSIFEAHRKEGGSYFKIPSAFSNAWLHCLLFMVQHASPIHASHKMAKTSLEKCILLIDQGLAEIMASLAPTPLHEKMALQPRGVMALIIKRLIEDVVGDSPDVLSTYASYMDELVSISFSFYDLFANSLTPTRKPKSKMILYNASTKEQSAISMRKSKPLFVFWRVRARSLLTSLISQAQVIEASSHPLPQWNVAEPNSVAPLNCSGSRNPSFCRE